MTAVLSRRSALALPEAIQSPRRAGRDVIGARVGCDRRDTY